MGYNMLLKCSKVQFPSRRSICPEINNVPTPFLFKYHLRTKDVVCPHQGTRLRLRHNKTGGFSSEIGGSLAANTLGYMGMMKISSATSLQPLQFRTSNVRRTISDALQMQVNTLFKELFQSDVVEGIRGHLASTSQSLTKSADLILREQQAIVGLEDQQLRNSYCRCQPLLFKAKYDLMIMSLEEESKKSHKALNCFKTGLLLHCTNNDPLLLKVSDLCKINNAASRRVAAYANMFHDYCCRFDIETLWIPQMAKRLEGNHELFTLAVAKVRDMKNKVLELIDIFDGLVANVRESPTDFEEQTLALRTLIRILESTSIYSNICSSVDEDVNAMCRVCENVRGLLSYKVECAARFYRTEEVIAQEIYKVKRSVDTLRGDVDVTRRLYNEKMRGIKAVQGPGTKKYIYKKGDGNSDDFSMRERKWGGRIVCPAIREQGRGKCAYVATVSGTESGYKRLYADYGEEFILKLSPDHLEDMVNTFYDNNSQRRPSEKLDVALGRLEELGVTSEEAYNDANFDLQHYKRYHIKGFEALNTANLDTARAKLNDGKALIGNFKITTEYHRLEGDDIYEIPEDAVFETNIVGHVSSHCVVILGYGMTPCGLPYYIFQNSYGPGWGKDGFGRVACRSLKRLYAPDLDS